MAATISATSGFWSLTFLSLAYAGILFQQPTLCATSVDIGKGHVGVVFGFMNTASNVASALSSVVFGYLVAYSGGYELPFIPMLVLLCVGVVLWLRVDPTQQVVEDDLPAFGVQPAAAVA
jgi:MFS-type transporter involved in bile tolerance (Atg22 family)